MEMNSSGAAQQLLVSVITVNYNCKDWLDRFFQSLRAQTIFDRVEVVIVDNTSSDGSAEICEKEMASWPNGVFLQTGGNYGFGGGSNRGAAIAKGKYLFFLNPDLRLEPSCLEELMTRAGKSGAKIGCPRVFDYDSDVVQTEGAAGFDIFGCGVAPGTGKNSPERFAVGTFYFIERGLFQKLGGFDGEFFIFGEELDLSWRAWIAGEDVKMFYSAHMHHQGASSGERAVENRTNESKRFYANRNQLLTLLKNSRCLLLVLVLNQIALLAVEAVIGALLARRFSFARWSLLKPLADCWRLRGHILAEREKIRGFRRRGDLWILRRFFRFGFGRWIDVKRLLKSGVKIDKARAAKK
jgi:GT2 family glycosyltransferase